MAPRAAVGGAWFCQRPLGVWDVSDRPAVVKLIISAIELTGPADRRC